MSGRVYIEVNGARIEQEFFKANVEEMLTGRDNIIYRISELANSPPFLALFGLWCGTGADPSRGRLGYKRSSDVLGVRVPEK